MTETCRIVLLGDAGIGRSSLVSQYVDHQLPEQHVPTVLDSLTCSDTIDGIPYSVEIVDCSADKEFAYHRSVYLATADVAVLVYSVKKKDTLQHLKRHLREAIIARKVAVNRWRKAQLQNEGGASVQSTEGSNKSGSSANARAGKQRSQDDRLGKRGSCGSLSPRAGCSSSNTNNNNGDGGDEGGGGGSDELRHQSTTDEREGEVEMPNTLSPPLHKDVLFFVVGTHADCAASERQVTWEEVEHLVTDLVVRTGLRQSSEDDVGHACASPRFTLGNFDSAMPTFSSQEAASTPAARKGGHRSNEASFISSRRGDGGVDFSTSPRSQPSVSGASERRGYCPIPSGASSVAPLFEVSAQNVEQVQQLFRAIVRLHCYSTRVHEEKAPLLSRVATLATIDAAALMMEDKASTHNVHGGGGGVVSILTPALSGSDASPRHPLSFREDCFDDSASTAVDNEASVTAEKRVPDEADEMCGYAHGNASLSGAASAYSSPLNPLGREQRQGSSRASSVASSLLSTPLKSSTGGGGGSGASSSCSVLISRERSENEKNKPTVTTLMASKSATVRSSRTRNGRVTALSSSTRQRRIVAADGGRVGTSSRSRGNSASSSRCQSRSRANKNSASSYGIGCSSDQDHSVLVLPPISKLYHRCNCASPTAQFACTRAHAYSPLTPASPAPATVTTTSAVVPVSVAASAADNKVLSSRSLTPKMTPSKAELTRCLHPETPSHAQLPLNGAVAAVDICEISPPHVEFLRAYSRGSYLIDLQLQQQQNQKQRPQQQQQGAVLAANGKHSTPSNESTPGNTESNFCPVTSRSTPSLPSVKFSAGQPAPLSLAAVKEKSTENNVVVHSPLGDDYERNSQENDTTCDGRNNSNPSGGSSLSNDNSNKMITLKGMQQPSPSRLQTRIEMDFGALSLERLDTSEVLVVSSAPCLMDTTAERHKGGEWEKEEDSEHIKDYDDDDDDDDTRSECATVHFRSEPPLPPPLCRSTCSPRKQYFSTPDDKMEEADVSFSSRRKNGTTRLHLDLDEVGEKEGEQGFLLTADAEKSSVDKVEHVVDLRPASSHGSRSSKQSKVGESSGVCGDKCMVM